MVVVVVVAARLFSIEHILRFPQYIPPPLEVVALFCSVEIDLALFAIALLLAVLSAPFARCRTRLTGAGSLESTIALGG